MDKIKGYLIKYYKPVVASLLILVILSVTLYSCRYHQEKNEKVSNSAVTEIDDTTENDTHKNEVDPNSVEGHIIEEIESGEVDDIYSMVCSAVEYKLNAAGFSCEPGVALTVENDNYEAIGTYYFKDDFNLFKTDSLQAVGFVEVVSDDKPFAEPSNEDSVIIIEPIEGENNADIICAYNYNDIGSSHFVFEDKYVIYNQQTPMRVVYSVTDNDPSKYDLSLGSLYDYDSGMFLYDETIFDEYKSHSAVKLFSEEDYTELEASLKEMSKQQLIAGYTVTQYDVIYISPEQIQAYLDGEEEDTFFGYSVADLTESLGIGTALEYSEGGLKQADVGTGDLSDYDWKTFLTKVGIGCGIIIVGAVLAPITGGASFSCALVTMVKFTVTASLCTGLGTMAIETAKGMMSGKSFKEALYGCTYSGLDAFANTFVITAGISAVGVNTGLIKPQACFVAGTDIATVDYFGNSVHKHIEDINVGDRVLSYSEVDGTISYQTVSEIFKRETADLVSLEFAECSIITTPEHPFYSITRSGWVSAADLEIGELIKDSKNAGGIALKHIAYKECDEPVAVFNLAVDENHTYFVGAEEVLVHNTCDNITRMRNQGVKNAWKEEVKAVKNGTSRYNWTPNQIQELLTNGKVSGFDGHHIIPVSQLKGTAAEYLISSADDIALIQHETHVLVHAGGNAAGNMDVLVECVPWVCEQLTYLLALAG